MIIEYSNNEIWKAWNKIIEYTVDHDGPGYPDGEIILIKKVLETLLESKKNA